MYAVSQSFFKVKKLMFHYLAYYNVLRHKSHNKLIQRSDKRKKIRVRENCVTDTCNITGHTPLSSTSHPHHLFSCYHWKGCVAPTGLDSSWRLSPNDSAHNNCCSQTKCRHEQTGFCVITLAVVHNCCRCCYCLLRRNACSIKNSVLKGEGEKRI